MTDGRASKAQPMAPEEFPRRHDVVQAQLVDALEAAFQLGEETTYDLDGPVPAWANLPEQLSAALEALARRLGGGGQPGHSSPGLLGGPASPRPGRRGRRRRLKGVSCPPVEVAPPVN